MSLPVAEILSIGSELLNGFTLNTNAHWLARKLTDAGFKTTRTTTIQDQKEVILQTLQELTHRRAQVIICTGGLGPTIDDITKATVAEFFNRKLVLDQHVLKHVQHIFSSRGIPMPEVNQYQAYVPEGCVVLFNEYGTAPGIWIEHHGQIFVFMPGVPYEMKYIFEHQVLPRIQPKSETKMRYVTITTRGIGESALMEKIKLWEEKALSQGLDVAYYPSPKSVKLRLSKETPSLDIFDAVTKPLILELQPLIAKYYVSTENLKLEEILAQKLLQRKQTVCTVESCTGGYIAHILTSIPGSSQFFNGSIVSYQNHIKSTLVGVQEQHFNTVGAVSEEVVMEMAQNGRRLLQSDFCVSTSGIAGPTGATETKPVGLVWVGVATPDKVIAKKFQFGKDRKGNIQLFAHYAIDFLLSEM